MRQALKGLHQFRGGQHPDTLAAASHLSSLLLHLRQDLGEAEPLARRAWEGTLRHFGPEHPRALRATADLGLMLLARGRPKEGEPLLRSALEGFQKQLGEKHLQALSTASDLGTALYSAGRKEDALAPLRLAFEGRQQQLGEGHLRTLASAHNLGVVLADLQLPSEASKLLQVAWEGRREKLGAAHPRTLASAKRLGEALQKGQEELAATVLRSLWEGLTEQLGASHPRAVEAARSLARWLTHHGCRSEAEAVLLHALAAAQFEELQAEELDCGRGSEDESLPNSEENRATRMLESALLGPTFDAATCREKLARVARQPPAAAVLQADIQDLQYGHSSEEHDSGDDDANEQASVTPSHKRRDKADAECGAGPDVLPASTTKRARKG